MLPYPVVDVGDERSLEDRSACGTCRGCSGGRGGGGGGALSVGRGARGVGGGCGEGSARRRGAAALRVAFRGEGARAGFRRRSYLFYFLGGSLNLI